MEKEERIIFPVRSGFGIEEIHQIATEVLRHYGQKQEKEARQEKEGSGRSSLQKGE